MTDAPARAAGGSWVALIGDAFRPAAAAWIGARGGLLAVPLLLAVGVRGPSAWDPMRLHLAVEWRGGGLVGRASVGPLSAPPPGCPMAPLPGRPDYVAEATRRVVDAPTGPSSPPTARQESESPHLARKPNYDFEKRKKEQERKQKQDAKREEKLRRKREGLPDEEPGEDGEPAVDGDDTPGA